MKRILLGMAVLAIATLAQAQNTNAPITLNPQFANNGKLKLSVTTGDTLMVFTTKKEAGVKTIPSGAFTYKVKGFDNGIVKGVVTFANTAQDSCCKIKPVPVKGAVRLPTAALYSNNYPVEDDTIVSMVYSKKIYFYHEGKKFFPTMVLPTSITDVLSKKALEEILVRHFLQGILKSEVTIELD